ncbi:MAG TPA: DUF2975 domain-containing protein [Candidatus Saccharimonadales bacterium]|nr:DUF2975 domain-containing protein [Candidatus Saccharimonadales bacterium]
MNKKSMAMKRSSTMFLRSAVILMGLVVLALCVFALAPAIVSDNAGDYRPLLIGMCVSALPFFFALYQALKLLSYIDRNKAFSELSAVALGKIKYCGLVISVFYTALMPYIYRAAQEDDAPGVIMLGLIIVGTSLVIAIFAGVLQKLLQNVLEIKSENDLTV